MIKLSLPPLLFIIVQQEGHGTHTVSDYFRHIYTVWHIYLSLYLIEDVPRRIAGLRKSQISQHLIGLASIKTKGYDFGVTFYPVENGIAGTPVTRDELVDASILKVVIINDPTNIRINGKIKYLSTENTRVVSDHESGVMSEEINPNDVAPYIYVIYEEGKK
jgi:hypothetical protein